VNDELTRRGIEQGHYRVLAKPFGTQQLLQTVADIRASREQSQKGIVPGSGLDY
jgi:hypothetical protein